METFNDIIKGDKPVLVDFYATWCGPCKAMSPVIEEIGKEMHGEVRVLKIDVDKNQEVSTQFQVQAVPTLIIFKKGEAVWRNAGAMDKASLVQQIKNFIE
ncbi:MAG: thioredoxin [Tannerella sp.]|jgi:thioredoxin 1|nr:thioredoxin [Tannerella sp.]